MGGGARCSASWSIKARLPAFWHYGPFAPISVHPGRDAHLTQVTLPRLPRRQAAELTSRVAHGKTLPPEVVEQVVAKTDGVPLFVEELTKMVLESGLLQEQEEGYTLTEPLPPLAIPTTLHDSLIARLDRLATVKGLAQLGATLGREFAYALLHAVSPMGRGRPCNGDCTSWWRRSSSTSGDCRRRRRTSSSMPSFRTRRISRCLKHAAAVSSAYGPGPGSTVS